MESRHGPARRRSLFMGMRLSYTIIAIAKIDDFEATGPSNQVPRMAWRKSYWASVKSERGKDSQESENLARLGAGKTEYRCGSLRNRHRNAALCWPATRLRCWNQLERGLWLEQDAAKLRFPTGRIVDTEDDGDVDLAFPLQYGIYIVSNFGSRRRVCLLPITRRQHRAWISVRIESKSECEGPRYCSAGTGACQI